jgi:hypothetical protein
MQTTFFTIMLAKNTVFKHFFSLLNLVQVLLLNEIYFDFFF